MANPWNQGRQTSTVRATREASEVGKLCLLVIGEGIHATYLLPESGTVLIGRQPGCAGETAEGSIIGRLPVII